MGTLPVSGDVDITGNYKVNGVNLAVVGSGTKLSALTALSGANIATGDLVELVDISDTSMAASGTNKKATFADLVTFLQANGFRRDLYNAAVSTPGAGFASDTYLVGSSIAIPSGALQAKTMYRCIFNVSKTTGAATPILNVRFGTAGTTGDASRAALTFSAGTAVTDEGIIEVWATFRTVGSGTSAVIQATGEIRHRLTTTGLTVAGANEMKTVTGGGFDSTVASSIIGLSVNGGTSANWTITNVQTELVNLV